MRTFLDRPGTTSTSRAGPLRSRTGVRSMMTVAQRSPRLVRRHTEGVPPARERSARGNRRRRGPPRHRSGGDRLTAWPERLSGSRCWRCARRSPERLPPDRPTCAPGQGPAAPTPPPRGSAGSWAQPSWRCPVSTPGGSGCRRSAAGAPPAAWASTPPVRGPGAVPRARPWAPQALQKGSSNPIGMRHSTMALVEVRSWPTAVSPRASSPRKVVRSGPVKVVSGTSRSLV